MKYTVEPIIEANCDCEECRAGRHFYELGQWEGDHWHWCGWSLQTYASAADCKRLHYWGDFQPGDTWEDGTPIAPPPAAQPEGQQPCGGGLVRLNTQALASSFEAMMSHSPRFEPRFPAADDDNN